MPLINHSKTNILGPQGAFRRLRKMSRRQELTIDLLIRPPEDLHTGPDPNFFINLYWELIENKTFLDKLVKGTAYNDDGSRNLYLFNLDDFATLTDMLQYVKRIIQVISAVRPQVIKTYITNINNLYTSLKKTLEIRYGELLTKTQLVRDDGFARNLFGQVDKWVIPDPVCHPYPAEKYFLNVIDFQ